MTFLFTENCRKKRQSLSCRPLLSQANDLVLFKTRYEIPFAQPHGISGIFRMRKSLLSDHEGKGETKYIAVLYRNAYH